MGRVSTKNAQQIEMVRVRTRTQLQDGSFMMDQRAHVDNIDPADIKPERGKTPEASVTEQETSSRAMAMHTDGCKNIMCRVHVTVFASSGYSWHVIEIQSNTQADDVKSCGVTGARTSRMGQQERPVLNSWFHLRSYDNTNLARRKTWCDSDSSSFWKIAPKSRIEFERRCRHWLTQSKSETSRD